VHARWKEFEAADYEGKLGLFHQSLDEPDLMDGELAFEMLSTLQHQMVAHQERHRFDEIAEALHGRLPDVYTEEAPYILSWRIDNALATGRPEVIPALARELALTADRAIDKVSNVIDQLSYHGQLSALLDMMPLAWPLVNGSADILPWAVDDFAVKAANFLVFDDVERHGSFDLTDPTRAAQLSTYLDVERERFSSAVGYLTGQMERPWAATDFDFAPLPEPSGDPDDDWMEDEEWEDEDEEAVVEAELAEADEEWEEADEEDEDEPSHHRKHAPEDPARRNLFHLSQEFLGYLRRESGVPYTRGELAREQVVRYILARFDGKLQPGQSLLGQVLHPKPAKAKPGPRPPVHPLCPDRDTLDRHLVHLLGFFNPQYYKAAALFESIPDWLRFLESRGLIDAKQRETTLRDVSGLAADLLKIWSSDTYDPALKQSIERWHENTGLRG
jgi:hypothetical protein